MESVERKSLRLTSNIVLQIFKRALGECDGYAEKDSFRNIRKTLVLELARHTRKIVKIVTGALVLIFAWLKLSAVDIVPLASNLPGGNVLQISHALYYLCWAAGSSFDIDAQELVFERVTTYQQSVAVLLLFWIVNLSAGCTL